MQNVTVKSISLFWIMCHYAVYVMARQPLVGCRDFAVTLRHTTLSRIPLDEWLASRRDLYLTTHNTHERQTLMIPVEFEPTIPGNKRLHTPALDRAATGIPHYCICFEENKQSNISLGDSSPLCSMFDVYK